jgi:hypothetical protein
MRPFMVSGRNLPVLAALLICSRAAAADVDKLLPKGSEFAIGINFKQMVQSGIAKKIMAAVKKENQAGIDTVVQPVLDALGFNPLTDLHEVIIAGVADKNSDKGLLIVRGQFDVAKFDAQAAELAKTYDAAFKADMIGENKVYVWTGNPPQTIFVAIADNATILAAANKVWMTEALDNIANQRASKPESKELLALLAKVDPKRSLWVAIPGSSLKKMPIEEGKLKDNVSDVVSVSGGITLTDNIKMDLAIVKSSQDSAKEMAKACTEGVRLLRSTFWAAPPLRKLVDTVKVTVHDTTVNVESHISAELLNSIADQTNASKEKSGTKPGE